MGTGAKRCWRDYVVIIYPKLPKITQNVVIIVAVIILKGGDDLVVGHF